MRKIRNSRDIEREKLRLRVQQLEQEKALRESWLEMKEDLRPGKLLRNKLAEYTREKPGEEGLVSGLVNAGTAYLSKKLTGYAGAKIDSSLQAGIEKAGEKLKTILTRKKKTT